ncbi:hypothetical protein Tco_0977741 [Tanacetum coccineum]|uniref:Uncharacterized protein n=1 Tax=Tanacetum coccineum TaxID=301880 RepID=A0ABQ5EL69_9ASTR
MQKQFHNLTVKGMAVAIAVSLYAGRDDMMGFQIAFSVVLHSKKVVRENHDLRRQLVEERCGRLELTYHVTRMERRQEFGEGVVDYMRFLIRSCTSLNRVASVDLGERNLDDVEREQCKDPLELLVEKSQAGSYPDMRPRDSKFKVRKSY